MDAVQSGAGRIFCIPVAAATAGTLTPVTKEGKGGGSLTVDGSPTNAFQVVIQITAQGGLNTAAFKASVNGGYSFSDEVTVPATGSHVLEGTGLTLHLPCPGGYGADPSLRRSGGHRGTGQFFSGG